MEGQFDLTLEAVYHNELIDEFNDLEGKIKQRLLEMQQKLAADGPILQQLADAATNIMNLTRQLAQFDAALNDQKVQIQSLLNTETGVLSKLNGALAVSDRVKALESQVKGIAVVR